MSVISSTLHVSGLNKSKMDALRSQAKAAGLSTEVYARQLIEEGMLLEQHARSKTFDELYAPIQQRFRRSGMSEAELDKLITTARRRSSSRRVEK